MVAKAVPSAVAPSASNTVKILTDPQLGPFQATTGTAIVPMVPNVANPADVSPQPGYGGAVGDGGQRDSGSAGAPSLPSLGGVLFTAGPIDSHYQSESEPHSPYGKVNNPPTRGMFTWVKDFLNGIATSQDTDLTGMKQRHPQQRTSHMRVTPPPHGAGYVGGEQFTPRQQPQQPNTYGYNPVTGTQPYGTGVLNSDTYGAGQTAGGVGGSNYTPVPGPPPTYSTASQDIANSRGMPTWG